MDPTARTDCPVYTKSETRDRIDLCGVWKHQIGTSAERRTYYPQLGQKYFDTDVGKLLICTDPAKRKWVDAMGVPAEQ